VEGGVQGRQEREERGRGRGARFPTGNRKIHGEKFVIFVPGCDPLADFPYVNISSYNSSSSVCLHIKTKVLGLDLPLPNIYWTCLLCASTKVNLGIK
jgi:hypothetical protein